MTTGRDARNSLNGIHVRAPERSKRQQPTYRCRTYVIICGLFPRIVNLALVGAEEQNPWRNFSLDRFPFLGAPARGMASVFHDTSTNRSYALSKWPT